MQSARRVTVTAAGGGIGLEIARALAADGAGVRICDIDEGTLRAVTGSEPAITGGDLELARSALREFNVVASSMREAGNQSGMPLEEAMVRLKQHQEGPVLLVEPSDNTEAGASGDSTDILRALVERGILNAGVVINDPETVRTLGDTRPGLRREVAIGGKSGEIGARPLALEVEVVSRSDASSPKTDAAGSPTSSANRSTWGPAWSLGTGA